MVQGEFKHVQARPVAEKYNYCLCKILLRGKWGPHRKNGKDELSLWTVMLCFKALTLKRLDRLALE